MYVNVAVLKETHPHERRVALVPGLCAKLSALGAKLHMQSGAGEASFFAGRGVFGRVVRVQRRTVAA
jgi:NAD/NADP transhydrogenase alpha subunit